MNLDCLYYKIALKPKMEAGWFIKLCSQGASGFLLEMTVTSACRQETGIKESITVIHKPGSVSKEKKPGVKPHVCNPSL